MAVPAGPGAVFEVVRQRTRAVLSPSVSVRHICGPRSRGAKRTSLSQPGARSLKVFCAVCEGCSGRQGVFWLLHYVANRSLSSAAADHRLPYRVRRAQSPHRTVVTVALRFYSTRK